MCSREERSRFCPSKLKQMNLLLLIDTLLDRCASVSIPLEWTPEWMCVRDSDLAQDAELRELVRRAFEALEINSFVQLMCVCAAKLFPPLREAWLPIYEEQSIRIFNKWRASLVRSRLVHQPATPRGLAHCAARHPASVEHVHLRPSVLVRAVLVWSALQLGLHARCLQAASRKQQCA